MQMVAFAIACCLQRLGRVRLWVVLLTVTLAIVALIYILVDQRHGSEILGKTAVESDSETAHSKDAIDLLNGDRTDLVYHLTDMRRLHASVMAELRQLEQRRSELKSTIERYQTHVAVKQKEAATLDSDTLTARLALDELNAQRRELAAGQQQPQLRLPPPLYASREENFDLHLPPTPTRRCLLHTCFDYSRCSLSTSFPVYIYEEAVGDGVLAASAAPWLSALRHSEHVTRDPAAACVYVAVVLVDNHGMIDGSRLRLLPHWRGEGRNHVLLFVGKPGLAGEAADTGSAIKALAYFTLSSYRPNFDVILHAAPPYDSASFKWEELPLVLPARRQHLLTFDGVPPNVYLKRLQRDFGVSSATSELRFMEELWQLAKEGGMSFDLSCAADSTENIGLPPVDVSEWVACGNAASRRARLLKSTFALIVAPANGSLLSTPSLMERLIEALHAGAVPVILGDHLLLPFGGPGESATFNWLGACLVLPRARVTELAFVLASIVDADIVALRLRGRELLEHHLGSASAIVDTLLAVVRTRLGMPALPARDTASPSALGGRAQLMYTPHVDPPDETLGVLEPSFASDRFVHNYTSRTSSSSPHFFKMLPHTPWDPILPTDAKFRGSPMGFRPINGGEGGAGEEFSVALGGNSPKEQFTIVVLTYDRVDLLQSQLAYFKGLPYLNKVIVVWNNPVPPADDLKWPDIGVTVHVIKTSVNSLNNRFLPFDAIETEAVLSVDDDVYLRSDEIVFAFRVWRENRERLVGFPGRYHAWDAKYSNWLYNSNHSCELSMVLTGAAFFHKYYMHIYSNVMQPVIREKVDEFMNCEDIAMNFLIAHITRKPPIKVTSRWTFLCPSCGEAALWTDKSHFDERHECINFFVRVYGYLPLLYTQYRADSVLFKTKVPSNKSKCFKYV